MLTEHYSEAYKARCMKRLKEWGAPVSEWECLYMYDVVEDEEDEAYSVDLFTCELCDCSQVRYVHVMHHRDYFENVGMGCVCAGIMEGNILAAKERDRAVKNRAKRKSNYLKREWRWRDNGNYTLSYKNHWLRIMPSKFKNGGFGVLCNGNRVWRYKGKTITNFLSAVHVAFDIVDPPIGGQRL